MRFPNVRKIGGRYDRPSGHSFLSSKNGTIPPMIPTMVWYFMSSLVNALSKSSINDGITCLGRRATSNRIML